MKRILKKEMIVVIFAIIVLYQICTMAQVWASTVSGSYTYDNLLDGTISIVGYSGTEQTVTVPTTIDGKKVSTLGMNAFYNNSTVRTVNLPEGLLKINAYAFDSCSNLTTVKLPSTLNFVSNIFYERCPNLTNYTIPSTLTKLSSNDYQRIANVNISGTYNYDKAKDVFNLVNEERTKLNLEPLELDNELMEAAMLRAAETSIYWDHIRPNGLSCFSVCSKINGENIGLGATSATRIMERWMNSPGHKAQIVKSAHKSIGIGCYYNSKNGAHYWVQVFSRGETQDTNILSGTRDVNNTVQVATDKGYINPDIRGLNETNTLSIGETLTPTSVRNKNTGPNATAYTTNIALSDLTWESSNTNIFTVDRNGTITAKNPGTATLTAKIGEFSATYQINVENPIPDGYKIQLNYNEYKLNNLSETVTLKDTYLSGDAIQWSSTNEQIATVDVNGKVTPKSGGFTYITATTKDYGTTRCWIYVCMLRKLSDGSKAYPGDLDRNGVINANDAAIVGSWYNRMDLTQEEIALGDLDGDGKVTALDKALINDIFAYGIFTPGKYNPIQRITLNKNELTLEEGGTAKLTATIVPTDTTDSPNITWKSSNEKIVAVDQNGNITQISGGKVTITATSSNGLSTTCEVTSKGTILPTYLLGDMDKDGEVTPYDAYIINVMFEQGKIATEEELQIGDVDRDGELTPYDAYMINVAFEQGRTLE